MQNTYRILFWVSFSIMIYSGFVASQTIKTEDYSNVIGMCVLLGDQEIATDYEDHGKKMTIENTNTNQTFVFVPYIKNKKMGEVLVKIEELTKDAKGRAYFKFLEKLKIRVSETVLSKKTGFKIQILSIGKAPDNTRCNMSAGK